MDEDSDLFTEFGSIDRIDDGVAWGEFESGLTFDIPSFGHMVGDEVRLGFIETEDDDNEITHCFVIMGDRHATVIFAQENDQGLEILETEILYRSLH